MGGGALMTPILVLLFHVEPLAAVSSDIVAAMVMKPIGGAVHWRRGTVQRGLVTWLMLGSIPSAFLGVLLLRRLDAGIALQAHIKLALGVALLVVVTGLVGRPLLISRRGNRSRSSSSESDAADRDPGRAGRRPHLGRLGIADHRRAAAALPPA